MNREELVRWFDKTVEFSLYGLILTLPFSKSMVEIFFVSALVSWVLKRWTIFGVQITEYKIQNTIERAKEKILRLIKMFRPVKTDLDLPIAVFLSFGFLSLLTSVSLPLSLEGFFFKLFEWIMLYFMIVETIDSREKINKILFVLLLSMVLIGIDGIFQFIVGTDFLRGYPIHDYRIRASFDGPNGLAAWLVVMIPLALSLAYSRRTNWFDPKIRSYWIRRAIRPFLWFLTLLLIGCLVLTYSRGAWIASILSTVFIGIKTSKRLLVATMIVLLVSPFLVQGTVKERAMSILSIDDQGAKNAKIKLWQEAVSIIKDFPLLGCGPNTYSMVIPFYTKTDYTGYYPHNSYLHMAAEMGLMGLAAFIWIIAKLFRQGLRNLKKVTDGLYPAFLTGLMAGLLGFLTHSFIDVHFYSLQLGILLWYIFGLVVATQNLALEMR